MSFVAVKYQKIIAYLKCQHTSIQRYRWALLVQTLSVYIMPPFLHVFVLYLYDIVIPYTCLPASVQVMVWNTVIFFIFLNLGLLRAGSSIRILVDLDRIIPAANRVTLAIHVQFSSVIFFFPFQRTSGTGNLTEWAARMWWRHSRSAARNFNKPGNDWEDP